ncbi:hypothetical protein AZE42_10440 [Rhizopogon vesiculosus]|uniref:Uncharacterized protein n=1 Tax=Rhizopogon vesiculosus TaxID=180088 RepID=A0A1J8QES9_9AGAM|nr:hypothetical protein AZE42_10440 [Rhizopogon vesiculosus]
MCCHLIQPHSHSAPSPRTLPLLFPPPLAPFNILFPCPHLHRFPWSTPRLVFHRVGPLYLHTEGSIRRAHDMHSMVRSLVDSQRTMTSNCRSLMRVDE